jgi:hypothetical protein
MSTPVLDVEDWTGVLVAPGTDVLAGTFVGVFVARLVGTLVSVWVEVGVGLTVAGVMVKLLYMFAGRSREPEDA